MDDDDRTGQTKDPGPRRQRLRLGAILSASVGAAAVGVVILVGLASAGAQTSPSRGASPGSGGAATVPWHGFGPGAWDHRGGDFEGGLGGMSGAVVHGEFTAVDPNGGYRTIDVQDGTVTAVSASSITVKSQDGFVKTYAVNTKTMVDAGRDGIANVKVGHAVHVTATVAGNAATAVDIFDRSNAPRLRGPWMPPGPGGAGWTSPVRPVPTTTPTGA